MPATLYDGRKCGRYYSAWGRRLHADHGLLPEHQIIGWHDTREEAVAEAKSKGWIPYQELTPDRPYGPYINGVRQAPCKIDYREF